jgi:esterase/lipase superfamily enzyme
MGRKQASVELTYEQKENFHANFRYMWDKLGTSYYYILGPDSMDDFNERRNGVNDELGLLPSYTICSKCYTGKDDFWPGRNTIRKVVNFYNRWITPEISVAEILSTRLVDSDYARFRIGSEMDPRFIGVYYGYYWSQHMKQMTGAYLILTPGGTMENTRMRAHLITGFRTDQDMHEQNLLNNVLSTNKISYTTYYEWFTGLQTQKQQTNYYEGEADSLHRKVATTFIVGNSMGGYGAMKMALKFPEKFVAAAGLSSVADVKKFMKERTPELGKVIFGDEVPDSEDLFALTTACESNPLRPRLYMIEGLGDFMLEENRRLAAHIKTLNYDFTYEEYEGIHDWAFWDTYVQKVLSWMFD